jgi:hypothetical protein
MLTPVLPVVYARNMANVNGKSKRGGQKNEQEGRVRVGARVAPQTLKFLESLNRPNMGRAIDAAVQIIVESGVSVEAGTLANPDLPRRVF